MSMRKRRLSEVKNDYIYIYTPPRRLFKISEIPHENDALLSNLLRFVHDCAGFQPV